MYTYSTLPIYRPVYVTRTIYRPVYMTPITHAPDYSPDAFQVQPDPCQIQPREAWEFLAMGEGYAALDAFACLADAYPEDGLVLLGYALASARIGDFDAASGLTRQAATIDPQALRYVPADDRLDDWIVDLIGHYGTQIARRDFTQDALFMNAALRAILRETGGAYFSITQAIDFGDDSEAAINLRDLLANMLLEEMYNTET